MSFVVLFLCYCDMFFYFDMFFNILFYLYFYMFKNLKIVFLKYFIFGCCLLKWCVFFCISNFVKLWRIYRLFILYVKFIFFKNLWWFFILFGMWIWIIIKCCKCCLLIIIISKKLFISDKIFIYFCYESDRVRF